MFVGRKVVRSRGQKRNRSQRRNRSRSQNRQQQRRNRSQRRSRSRSRSQNRQQQRRTRRNRRRQSRGGASYPHGAKLLDVADENTRCRGNGLINPLGNIRGDHPNQLKCCGTDTEAFWVNKDNCGEKNELITQIVEKKLGTATTADLEKLPKPLPEDSTVETHRGVIPPPPEGFGNL